MKFLVTYKFLTMVVHENYQQDSQEFFPSSQKYSKQDTASSGEEGCSLLLKLCYFEYCCGGGKHS